MRAGFNSHVYFRDVTCCSTPPRTRPHRDNRVFVASTAWDITVILTTIHETVLSLLKMVPQKSFGGTSSDAMVRTPMIMDPIATPITCAKIMIPMPLGLSPSVSPHACM